MLIDLIGPVGGKLHTGRSRNDQVATDMHLFLKNRVGEVIELIELFQKTLVAQAEDACGNTCTRIYTFTTCATNFICTSLNGLFLDARTRQGSFQRFD